MKRIILAAVMGGGLFLPGNFIYAGSTNESTVKAAPLVKISQVKGDTDDFIGPVYFPNFYKNTNVKSSESGCENYLTKIRNQKMYPDYIDKNGFNANKARGTTGAFLSAKNCKHACTREAEGSCAETSCANGQGIDVESGSGKSGKVTVDDEDFYDLAGLKGEIEISPGYEKLGKILISWTVRVVGNIPKDCDHYTGTKVRGIAVWPVLCHPWHGISYQDYEGGQVKTRLYISQDNKTYFAVGKTVEMTVPPLVSKVKVGTGSDPTLTGSCMLSPDDFGGELPKTIQYKLKWSNHTALRIKSPGKQRNLVVTLMPITKAEAK